MATSPLAECSAPASTSAPTRRACWSPTSRTGGSARSCSSAPSPASARASRAARSRARRSPRSRASSREQRAIVEQLGCVALRVVATAAIRDAANAAEFTRRAARARAGSTSRCSTARRRRGWPSRAPRARSGSRSSGSVGVVDVGGGSTELAIGTLAGGATWSESFRVGSGLLTDRYRRSDPPSAAELNAMREHAHGVFEGLDLPPVDAAVAVGGSAASLRRLVGADARRRTRCNARCRCWPADPADAVAQRFSIDRERVLLMPAGLTVLDAAGDRVRPAAAIGRGAVTGRCHLRAGRRVASSRL